MSNKDYQMEAVINGDKQNIPSDYTHAPTATGDWITIFSNRPLSKNEFDEVSGHQFTGDAIKIYAKQAKKTIAYVTFNGLFDDGIIGCVISPIQFYTKQKIDEFDLVEVNPIHFN